MCEEECTYSAEFPCPYFTDGRLATHKYILIGERESETFDEYLQRGYRRISTYYYRTVCKDCSACIPIRLETGSFNKSRSHRRTLRKNMDVRIEIAEPSITSEKTSLFLKYQRIKHGDDHKEQEGGIALYDIHYGFHNTVEMDYYLGRKLIGVGIVDVAGNSISSNYFYYDTDFLKRRLGVLSALNEISLSRITGKKYYYLGYYIDENPKMSYKKFFRPNQVLAGGCWRDSLQF